MRLLKGHSNLRDTGLKQALCIPHFISPDKNSSSASLANKLQLLYVADDASSMLKYRRSQVSFLLNTIVIPYCFIPYYTVTYIYFCSGACDHKTVSDQDRVEVKRVRNLTPPIPQHKRIVETRVR